MSSSAKGKRPWDTLEYQQIASASYRSGEVFVSFADGSEARVSPHCLIARDENGADWPNVRAEDFHLVVPSRDGEIEIPWDVIRVQSDPEFDAFWEELVAESVELGGATRVERAS